VDARDALDQPALCIGESIIGERDVAKSAQDGIELAAWENFEVHAPG
jgi:hypothetical protein